MCTWNQYLNILITLDKISHWSVPFSAESIRSPCRKDLWVKVMLDLYLRIWVCFVCYHGMFTVSFLLNRLVDDFYCFYVFLIACLKAIIIFQRLACLLTRSCDILLLAKTRTFWIWSTNLFLSYSFINLLLAELEKRNYKL